MRHSHPSARLGSLGLAFTRGRWDLRNSSRASPDLGAVVLEWWRRSLQDSWRSSGGSSEDPGPFDCRTGVGACEWFCVGKMSARGAHAPTGHRYGAVGHVHASSGQQRAKSLVRWSSQSIRATHVLCLVRGFTARSGWRSRRYPVASLSLLFVARHEHGTGLTLWSPLPLDPGICPRCTLGSASETIS